MFFYPEMAKRLLQIEEVKEDILSGVCQTPEMQELQDAIRNGLYFRPEWWASLTPDAKQSVETNAAIIKALKWVYIATLKVEGLK